MSDCHATRLRLAARNGEENGEVPERLNGTVSKTVVGLVPTVGSNPTLSAGRKILAAVKAAHYRQPQSFGDMVLTDRGLTTEIAQFQLGDLAFKVEYRHFMYSSALINQHLTDRPWTGGVTSWRG